MNIKDAKDKKNYCKATELSFFEKSKSSEKILFIENSRLIRNYEYILSQLNRFLSKSVAALKHPNIKSLILCLTLISTILFRLKLNKGNILAFQLLMQSVKSMVQFLLSFKQQMTISNKLHNSVQKKYPKELLYTSKSSKSSHPKVFCYKGLLKNFTNQQENTCAGVFLIKNKLY